MQNQKELLAAVIYYVCIFVDDEKSVCHSEDEILDDDEEAELTESEPESEDEEIEDCVEKESTKPKSAYVDDEVSNLFSIIYNCFLFIVTFVYCIKS